MMGDRGPPWKLGKYVPVVHDKVVKVLLLGRAEVLARRNLRDLALGRQRQGSGVRGSPPPLHCFRMLM